MYWNVKTKLTGLHIFMPIPLSRSLTLFIYVSIIKPLLCSAWQTKLFIVCNMPSLKFILCLQLPQSSLAKMNALTWTQAGGCGCSEGLLQYSYLSGQNTALGWVNLPPVPRGWGITQGYLAAPKQVRSQVRHDRLCWGVHGLGILL